MEEVELALLFSPLLMYVEAQGALLESFISFLHLKTLVCLVFKSTVIIHIHNNSVKFMHIPRTWNTLYVIFFLKIVLKLFKSKPTILALKTLTQKALLQGQRATWSNYSWPEWEEHYWAKQYLAFQAAGQEWRMIIS